jgi:hypothetical protein
MASTLTPPPLEKHSDALALTHSASIADKCPSSEFVTKRFSHRLKE